MVWHGSLSSKTGPFISFIPWLELVGVLVTVIMRG